MPATPGTIAEYDLVLSVSEAAINKQMQMLYDHKLEDAEFRPAHPVDGGLPAAPAKYAINHDWNIQVEKETYDDGTQHVVQETGIFAHIECPYVSFSDDSSPDIATIKIKFRRDESVQETMSADGTEHTSPDSRFYYYSGVRRPVLNHININGWTLTWQVKLRQKNIENVMTDLIARHEDPHDPTYLSPGLTSSLKGLNPKVFTVASIFCLLEDDLFVNTVKLLNPLGIPVNGSTADMSLVNLTKFVTMVNLYFRGIADAQKKSGIGGEGIPNPDSPFVLGYGLSQDIQAMNDVNNRASWENSPAYFIPNNFHLTTKRGILDSVSTLNFCMLTHTSWKQGDDHPRGVDPEQDLNAGRLSESFFDHTKVNFGDGIMAWSQDIFWRRWVVGTIVPTVYIDPHPIIDNFMRSRGVNSVQYQVDSVDAVDNGGNRWARTARFRTNTYEQEGNWNHGAEMWVEGYSATTVTVSSDFTNRGQSVMASDQRRSIYIKCSMQFSMESHFETYAHVINPPRYRAYQSDLNMRYEVDLRLEAGTGGVWSVSFDNVESQRPTMLLPPRMFVGLDMPHAYLSIQDIGDSPPPANSYGAWAGNHEYNSASIFSSGDIQNQMKSALTAFGGQSVGDLANHLQDLVRNSKQTIMMPGGEVFTFNGMDTDDSGQAFVHLSYALGAEGTTHLS